MVPKLYLRPNTDYEKSKKGGQMLSIAKPRVGTLIDGVTDHRHSTGDRRPARPCPRQTHKTYQHHWIKNHQNLQSKADGSRVKKLWQVGHKTPNRKGQHATSSRRDFVVFEAPKNNTEMALVSIPISPSDVT